MKRKLKRKFYFIFFIIGMTLLLSGFKVYQQHLQIVKKNSIAFESQKEKSVDIVEQPLIVIDPGHGGIDSGSENEGILEKDINLQISLKLKQALLDKGYRVLMTRSDDTALELRERSNFANEIEADLFISVHQNCYKQDKSVSGIEVYYNETKTTNDDLFAQLIQQALIDSTGARDRGTKEQDSLVVTRETNMPAVLVETAFISNPQELPLITSSSYQNQVIDGIINGIEMFLNQ